MKRLWAVAAGFVMGKRCAACGVRSLLIDHRVLWPALIAEWELSPEWVLYFDQREGTRCGFCCASLRDRQLAQGIIEVSRLVSKAQTGSLRELCKEPAFRAWRIAEINAAGSLHKFLKELPGLAYSEFGSTEANVRSENLLALSYADDLFDMVITSETLEHVPDIDLASREIYRVLKPGGWHVFSVPVVWDRPRSRKRASLQQGQLVHHMPPSYHGSARSAAADFLVFYEFGGDVVERFVAAGFELRLLRDADNPALVTFMARKPAKVPLRSS